MAPRASSSRHPNKKLSVGLIVALIVVALITARLGFAVYNSILVQGSATGCFITDKSETSGKKGKNYRKLHTEGCNGNPEPKILSVDTNLFVGSDRDDVKTMFSEIEIGETYDFETRGSEVSFLGVHENVVNIKK